MEVGWKIPEDRKEYWHPACRYSCGLSINLLLSKPSVKSKLEKCITKSYSYFMKRLCTKWFKKWAKKVKLSNHHLIEAIDNLEKGLSVADLVGADLLGIDARQIEDLKKKQGLFNLEV